MWEKKKWRPLAGGVFLAQVLLEVIAVVNIHRLDMVPTKYLVVLYVVLAGLTALTAFLLFKGTGHGPSHKRRHRRIASVVIALIVGISSVIVTSFAAEAYSTVNTVTAASDKYAAVEGVYVLKTDRAVKIQDTKDYKFGVMDGHNTQTAVDKISNKVKKAIKTIPEKSASDSASALYSGDVQAVILNEAYVDTLTDTDKYADFRKKTRLIYEVPIKKTTTSNKAVDVTKEPFVLYISGSDTRSKVLDTSRSDVNILMVVNPSTNQILLLNTPRDYYVKNPAGNGAYDKLTHCGLYGISCSEQALGSLYNTDINYYVQINFTGFEKLIDSIGGITVDSPQAFTAQGYSFKKGKNNLNGAQALAFARERHAFTEGDNMRGENQMRVIKAVISKLTSDGGNTLLHYKSIMDSLSGTFVTDLTSKDISKMVKKQLSDGGSWNVQSYAVSGKTGMDTTYSMPGTKVSVMYQDTNKVVKGARLIDKVKNDEKLTSSDVNEEKLLGSDTAQ